MIADCPPHPKSQHIYSLGDLEKITSLPGSFQSWPLWLWPHQETRHQPQAEVEPELWPCPVEGALLQEALEGRQGWQTAAGVKWRWIIKTDKGPGWCGEAGWRWAKGE